MNREAVRHFVSEGMPARPDSTAGLNLRTRNLNLPQLV